MRYRRSLLRVLGVVVAAIVLMAATQLLLVSFETSPLLSTGNAADLRSWITDRPSAGGAMLSGIALVLIAMVAAWALISSFGVDRRVMTTRNKDGWTKLDRESLEDSFERSLAAIDRRNDVSASITRTGRVDLTITTPDPSAAGSIQELRDALDQLCAERSLPCRSGRIVADVPRRLTTRRQIR